MDTNTNKTVFAIAYSPKVYLNFNLIHAVQTYFIHDHEIIFNIENLASY